MKNFEYFEKEINELINQGCNNFAVANGKPRSCDGFPCESCDLYNRRSYQNCNFVGWLYEEHVEKPKISKRTKQFFETIQTGWVARDPGGPGVPGVLFLYNNKPNKGETWINIRGEWTILGGYFFNFLTLDFIKWEDDEPWRVEDILKLEVED